MNSHAVLESLATEVRVTQRILLETWGGIRRTGWMNLIIIITMASILSIFGVVSAFVLESQLFVDNIGSTLQISVYVDPDEDFSAIKAHIQKMPNIRKIQVIPREYAWEEMKSTYDVPDIQNPLPNTLHVQVSDKEHIQPTFEALNRLEGVEKVNYAQNVLEKLQDVAQLSSIVGLTISLFLGVLTMFIISNTIHLLIQARSREIEILRMMGVGNWYIRLPFLFQGALYGIFGAIIAFAPLFIAEFYISEMFQYFQFSTSGYSVNFISTVMIMMALVVGAGGAALSVHRYLKT